MKGKSRFYHHLIRSFTVAIVANLVLGGLSSVAVAGNDEIANEATTLFRSARAVISKNQSLINDASKGNKGLHGDKVVAATKVIYKKNTGGSLNTKSKANSAMIAAIKTVMEQAQPLINEKGKGFKGFLPAIFAKQVAVAFNTNMADRMHIKLTAPKSYVRNRANRPDKWENGVIEGKFKSAGYKKGKPFSEQAKHKGKVAFRYILPEYYKPSCLKCHGEPKGERDITGGKKEGGKNGELGGAISFTIYK